MVSNPADPVTRETLARNRIAPMEDEEMLAAVQRGLAEVVIPELRRLGADEFVISQAHSIMSIVGFTRRGLYTRQKAREECDSMVAALGASATTAPIVGGELGLGLTEALRQRLELDIAGRIR